MPVGKRLWRRGQTTQRASVRTDHPRIRKLHESCGVDNVPLLRTVQYSTHTYASFLGGEELGWAPPEAQDGGPE